jgi:glutathione S-transferase
VEELIYHIADERDWREAQRTGLYRVSTRGRTLDEEGFIHCSRASQVAAVAGRFYAGLSGLVLLTIDPARVRAEVRHEAVPGSDELFPHIYGPLDTDAVTRAEAFDPGATPGA